MIKKSRLLIIAVTVGVLGTKSSDIKEKYTV